MGVSGRSPHVEAAVVVDPPNTYAPPIIDDAEAQASLVVRGDLLLCVCQ